MIGELTADEGDDPGSDIGELPVRYPALPGGFADAPIQAPDLIREDDPVALAGERDLEGIAFGLGRHRAADYQAGLAVVRGGAQDEGRAMARLLVPCLRIELQPDDVAGFGNKARGHYQTSRPTAAPIGISPCRLASVMPSSNGTRSTE